MTVAAGTVATGIKAGTAAGLSSSSTATTTQAWNMIPVASARKTFSKAAFGPFFTEVIDLYESGTATLVWDSFVDSLGSCQGYTDTDEETGETTTYNVSALSFPRLGDDTLAVRITTAEATLLGFATFDVILIRKGEVILFVGHISVGFEGPDSELNEALTRAAYQRMQSKIP